MSDDERPLLADFGISHLMANTTSTTTAGVGGSVRWMAVELLNPMANAIDAGKHTMYSDVWAYGMVLHVSIALTHLLSNGLAERRCLTLFRNF